MTYPFGILIALFSLAASIIHLGQDASTFWDFVGAATVFGGTLAVAVIILPWNHRPTVFKAILGLFSPGKRSSSSIVPECIDFMQELRGGGTPNVVTPGLAGEVLRDGVELISLGFEKSKIHEILEDRIHFSFERYESVANAIRSMAKYPPAFGLAGTVLGLVTLMKSVSQGADAKQTGALMAIALMATFYGLLVANMIINPAGEHILKTARADRKRAEIALHAILLHLDGVTLLESQEILNSYVTQSERVNVMGAGRGAEASAEAA